MNISKKCVAFAPEEDLVKVHVVDAMDCSMFLSCFEFHKFKTETFNAVSGARKEGFAIELEGVFIKTGGDVQKRLNRFVRKSDYRGVERYICEAHLEERRISREHAIRAVLVGQQMGKQQDLDADDLAVQLRKISLIYSINAKIFARRLGKADEAACCPKKYQHHCRHKDSSDKKLAASKNVCNATKVSQFHGCKELKHVPV